MGVESNSGSKRNRAEDELYLDNFHVHKRYLSEVMASSLNGLKVGDTLSGGSKSTPQVSDAIDSPAVTETPCFSKSFSSYPSNGDDISTLDSYMSDDSDDSICFRTGRNYETPPRTLSSLCEPSRAASSAKCSKVSTICSSSSQVMMQVTCSQSKQRMPDPESRFPPSPSDPCYGADLRRAALLRSSKMRVQSPVAVLDNASVDECLDSSCVNDLTEVEDQCSPSSTNFDDLTVEQSASNHDILGSPIHGTSFAGQGGRVSTSARSLVLDECASNAAEALYPDMDMGSQKITLSNGLSHSQGIEYDASMYREEVSEDSNRKQWSTPRRGQLCTFFYKGVIDHNVRDDQDQE